MSAVLLTRRGSAMVFALLVLLALQNVCAQSLGKRGRVEDRDRRVTVIDEEDVDTEVVIAPETGVGSKSVSAFVRNRAHNPQDAVDAGLSWTGLTPLIPAGFACPGVMDDEFALDYSAKQGRPFFHAGIDLAAPHETPVIAAAAGQVVAIFEESANPKGREVVILHLPETTGFPYWVYTQYTHLAQPPLVTLGQRVRQGELIGVNGNSGARRKPGSKNNRRPALHYGAFISDSEVHVVSNGFLIPKNGRWIDPLALYRASADFDSKKLSALDASSKKIAVRVALQDGSVHPLPGPFIWPMVCHKN